ncbi:hypothetical protein A2933_00570 [Candidatus Nomurabacteria bacterium RIFCSPLOWO2_01_FULL_46_18]|uniref:Glycosyl transferase family 1 n=1 Tax=Candidatus Nomurabacteria bacterium RIFCSPLOWO2_01_FULL_46_18 TaxID=1801783 RepID=A0A1F6XEJ1_9BACT|nr:MAG: hypothetical protein A2933_00570 [Candidatus Nomurabacteria bacterium RIFCSPLOWO2_01_FULL_46_18]
MKIIYGITKSNFGGAQRYVFDLATEAKKFGHDVAVICGSNGALVEKLKAQNVRVISLPYMQRDISILDEMKSFFFILKILREEKPEVFHTNSSKMGGLGNLAARLAGIKKIIFTGHGWEFNAPRPWWQKIAIMKLIWLTIALSHKTICVSEKTKNDLRHFPFIQNKLGVIHNGIGNFDLLERSAARRVLGVHAEDTLVVGTLSELHPVKGLDILLAAWERFTKKNDGLLVMMGDGELRENLEDYAADLGISEKVKFTGYLDNARQYLSGLDIFCLPSRSEALPYTLLEAGFASQPVIATNVGGIPETIENGLSGALVPPEDSETLFSTLLLFSQDETLRNRLGTALKETVSGKFSLSKMVEKTLTLY